MQLTSLIEQKEDKAILDFLQAKMLHSHENIYKQNYYSLKYQDDKIEHAYREHHYNFIQYFSKIVMIEVALLNMIDLIVTIIGYTEGRYQLETLLKGLFIAVAMQASMLIHYLLQSRFRKLSHFFSLLQNTLLTVSMVEKCLLRHPRLEELSTLFVAVVAISATFSILSFSQLGVFAMQLLMTTYMYTRLLYYYTPSLRTSLRLILFYLSANLIILIFSRAF